MQEDEISVIMSGWKLIKFMSGEGRKSMNKNTVNCGLVVIIRSLIVTQREKQLERELHLLLILAERNLA